MVKDMNRLIINKCVDFIDNNSNSNYNEYDLLKIKYGLEGIYLTITKIIIILLIGFIFKFLDTLIITLIFFNILRFFAFGMHAKESWQCLLMSIILFNGLPYLLLNISINNYIFYFISLFSIISFLLFAPSDTEKRPLTNKKKRIIRKISSIIVSFIYILLYFYFTNIRVPILCSLLIESIMINPISYKLFGLSYNNYKKA